MVNKDTQLSSGGRNLKNIFPWKKIKLPAFKMAAKQEQARNLSEAVASYFRLCFTNASSSMVPSLGERGLPTKKLAEGSEEARAS